MRQRVILTITLTGPECHTLREEAVATHLLGLCTGTVQGALGAIGDTSRIGWDITAHHLRQQDEDALWETVGREG